MGEFLGGSGSLLPVFGVSNSPRAEDCPCHPRLCRYHAHAVTEPTTTDSPSSVPPEPAKSLRAEAVEIEMPGVEEPPADIAEGADIGDPPGVDPLEELKNRPPPPKRKRTFMDQMEAFISRMTSRSTFWHRLGSLIWLPYAFKSGIKIRRVDDKTFSAVLPFRRFNRNWYNAMAGASLLANSEIAGGMYIYGRCGGDYTVVCKNLTYRFLRPCFGPAIYRITPKHDLDALLATGHEFNIDIDLDVVQQLPTRGLGREIRVGRSMATFHVTPKAVHEARAARRKGKA